MSSLADQANYDDYAAMAAQADLARRAQLVCDRAEVCHASAALIRALYDGIIAETYAVDYAVRDGWLVDEQTVAAWVQAARRWRIMQILNEQTPGTPEYYAAVGAALLAAGYDADRARALVTGMFDRDHPLNVYRNGGGWQVQEWPYTSASGTLAEWVIQQQGGITHNA